MFLWQEELLLPDQPDSSSSSGEDDENQDADTVISECPVEEPDAEGNCPV